jgi:hypothetical protein
MPTTRLEPGYRRVVWIFLRLLGLCFFAAFLSLGVQVVGLIGKDGLLPLGEFLAAARQGMGTEHFRQLPTVFWAAGGDGALTLGIAAGLVLSLALVFDLAPRVAIPALWLLYLSFVTACREFLSFQWDNLLLECAFLAIFIAPGHWLPTAAARAAAVAPHPIFILLFRWLLFRLLIESGLAKLLSGDPTWRDLTALSTYFETAPLPTWIGWHAHQLPLAWHQVGTALTLGYETLAPFAIFGPRRVRIAFLPFHVAFQLATLLTANYGFFNYLSLALGVFLIDDGQLRRGRAAKAPPATPPAATDPAASPLRRTAVAVMIAAVIVPVSVIEFARMWVADDHWPRPLVAACDALSPFRSVNRYHLFANMTLRRLEVEIQGTADGVSWETYEFRAKPGDPHRAPPFVAPHQPRLDFQLWFLTLHGNRRVPAYFVRLIRGLCAGDSRAASFFARNPFPTTPPTALRVTVWRYRMSTREERARDGVWWTREQVGTFGQVPCGPDQGPR